MDNYKYNAISKNGAKVSGVVEAFNELDAVERIKQSCNVILHVEKIKEKGESNSILAMEIGGNKLNTKAFTLMCSQFAIILRAGVSINRTTKLIAAKITDKPLKKMLDKVAEDVSGGRSLSASFEEHGGKLLPLLFLETVKAGELSGNIDTAFQSMADHFDKQTKIKQKVKGALTYPIFVLIIAVAVVYVLMAKVVPTFTSIFDSYGADLPVITKILIAISNFFRDYGLLLIGLIVFIIVGIKLYSKTEKGKMNCAKFALSMPVMGKINELNAASQFANNMSALIKSGILITKAVRTTSKIISNQYVSSEINKMAGKLEDGHSLGDCLRENPVLPDILVDMVAVGEETGELEETLDTTAMYYDSELEVAIAQVLAKLEPTLLLFVAAIAGFIVIAIYVSMFQMYAVM